MEQILPNHFGVHWTTVENYLKANDLTLQNLVDEFISLINDDTDFIYNETCQDFVEWVLDLHIFVL